MRPHACTFVLLLALLFRKSLWTEEPMVHLAVETPEEDRSDRWDPAQSHWNWTEHEGEALRVTAYTNCDSVNCDSVRLSLNGEALGAKAMSEAEDGVLRWTVPYRAGTLRAVGMRNGQEAATHNTLQTAGAPSKSLLESNRQAIRADDSDVAHVKAHIVDQKGRTAPQADHEVTLEVTGPGEIIAVGNGDHNNVTPYGSNTRKAYEGTLLMMVQACSMPQATYPATAKWMFRLSTPTTTSSRPCNVI